MENKLSDFAKETRLQLYNIVKIAIENGNKHIQLGSRGCIKVRKNKNVFFYSEKNGKGNGADIGQFTELIDCINSVCDNGWYNKEYTQITYK